jgi:hypothetical protein
MLSTQIEIARAPEDVRKVLLDFEQIPSWSQGYIKSIKPVNANAKLEPGEKLKCILSGMSFNPTIIENNEHVFCWRGRLFGIPGVFVGEHAFRFEPSKTTSGGTTFIQEENFSGVLKFMISEGSKMEKETRTNFEGFNEDLKARCERE